MLPRRNFVAAAIAAVVAFVCWPFKAKITAATPRFSEGYKWYPSARFCFVKGDDPTRFVLDVADLPTRSTPQARDFFRCLDISPDPKSVIEISKHGHKADPYVIPFRWARFSRRIVFSWNRSADIAIFLDLDRIFDLTHDEFAAWSYHVEYLFHTNNWFRSRCEESSRLKQHYREARLRDPRTVSV